MSFLCFPFLALQIHPPFKGLTRLRAGQRIDTHRGIRVDRLAAGVAAATPFDQFYPHH